MTKYLDDIFDFDDPHLIECLDEIPWWSAPFGERLLEKIQYKKNITALDIGFGTGFPLIEVAMRLGESARVYGIDIWDSAIARAERKIKQFAISNIHILKGEAASVPLNDQSVDLIVSNNGINNVGDIGLVLRECYRIMKPGAQFVMTMNLNTSMKEFYTVFEDYLKRNNRIIEIENLHQHIYSKRKPLDEIKELLENNKLAVKEIIHDNFDYRFVDGTAMLNHYFIKLAFLDSWKSIVPLHQQKEVFCELESTMNQLAEKQGEFRLSIPFVTIDCFKTS